MNRKILSIILIIFIFISTYNYVYAKYKKEQYIQIAEVNIEKTPIKRKKYILKVYYMNEETNKAMKIQISGVYEGDKYEVEMLEFEGYTYSHSNEALSGTMQKNLNVFLYYKKT